MPLLRSCPAISVSTTNINPVRAAADEPVITKKFDQDANSGSIRTISIPGRKTPVRARRLLDGASVTLPA